MSSTTDSRHSGKFAIALLGKNSEFDSTIQHLILSNGNGSVQTLNDFVVLENESFRIISTHDFFDEECPYPDQKIIDFMAHSYDGLHLFILAIDSENSRIDEAVSQIDKLQDIFGETVTQNLVVVFENYKSHQSLSELKEMFNIELGTLSEHLVHDCMKWCSKRQLFLHNYRNYTKEVVKRRMNDLNKPRNEHRRSCKRSGSHIGPPRLQSWQSTHCAPGEVEPEQYHADRKCDTSETEFNMVLLGLTGTGKSASGNTILTAMNPQLEPKKLFKSRPSSTPVTTQCQFRTQNLFGRQVRVVDTPDFFDDNTNCQAEVEECKKYCKPWQCWVLLVIQMGRFTDGEKRILERLEEKLGWRIRERTIILLTHGENVKDQGQSFIAERSHLSHIVQECGNRYHAFKNNSKKPKQVMELFKKIPDYESIIRESTEKQPNSDCCLC